MMISLVEATDLLRLLGDPTRVRLMALLENEELTVAELTRITRLGQSRISTHLGKLREVGLVRVRRSGASSFYKVNAASIPPEARRAWEFVRTTAEDPLLDQDTDRLAETVKGRGWADTVAGHMERHYSPGRTWEAALRGILGLARLGKVLDVASGDCAIAELVAPRAESITCLDLSRTVLAAGQARLRHLSTVAFRRGDMHALPFSNAGFDHVLLLACLCYAREPALVVEEAARVLRPGGSLVAVTLKRHRHSERVARFGHLQTGFTKRRLREMFRAAGFHLDLCEVTSRERRPPHFEVITVHASR
ncbi:MAG: ArsR/SmtB family transcription factor [Planctomycetota bacterium]|jgi:ArsR family transcriptional regulator